MSSQPPGNSDGLASAPALHESASAVLTAGDHYLVIGSVERPPGGATKHPASAGENPIFYDEARYSTWATLLDDQGQPMWHRVYDAPQECRPRAAVALPDGFVIAGEHRSGIKREYQGFLVRVSQSGEEMWRQVLGRPGVTSLKSVVVLGDGTIVAAGNERGRAFLVAVDGAGALRWERTLDDLDQVNALILRRRDGLVLVGVAGGSTTELGTSRLIAFGGDINGESQPLWQTSVPSEGSGELSALAAMQDGGVVAVGRSDDGGRLAAWVVRIGPAGAVLSSAVLPSPHNESARAVVALPDGGYAAAGDSLEDFRDRRARVWRMAADGTVRWQQSYAVSSYDVLRGLVRTPGDDGLLAVGQAQRPAGQKNAPLILRIAADGREVWSLGHPGH